MLKESEHETVNLGRCKVVVWSIKGTSVEFNGVVEYDDRLYVDTEMKTERGTKYIRRRSNPMRIWVTADFGTKIQPLSLCLATTDLGAHEEDQIIVYPHNSLKYYVLRGAIMEGKMLVDRPQDDNPNQMIFTGREFIYGERETECVWEVLV